MKDNDLNAGIALIVTGTATAVSAVFSFTRGRPSDWAIFACMVVCMMVWVYALLRRAPKR